MARPNIVFSLLLVAVVSLAPSRLAASADIHVFRAWDSVAVPNGNSFAFPNTAVSTSISRLFRIENHGTSTLTLSNYTSLVSGTGFSQIETPSSSVPPGGQTTFRVRFLRGIAGMYFGQVTIYNNSNQSPYVIHLAASAGTFPPPSQSMFVLSSQERSVWTPPDWTGYLPPPSCTLDSSYWGNGWEVGPLKYLWESFCFGQAGAFPPDPASAANQWFDPNGTGSQNHGPLYLGASALGHALRGNVADYDLAVEKALQILALDLQPTGQGHMRHESVGQYSGFWEGGIAAMALAGKYQPQGSTRGAELLAAARNWWRDHVGVLRRLRVSDGQVALVGARLGRLPGAVDSRASMSAAVNLQLIDPLSYTLLHPWIQSMVSSTGQPGNGFTGSDGQVNWRIPKEVAQRWVVLRAVHLGALEPVPTHHPVRCLAHRNSSGQPVNVYRWQAGGRTHTALSWIYGYGQPGIRWHVSWGPVSPYPGSVLQVEAGTEGGPSGKGPHPAPSSVQIPAGAEFLVPGC